MKKAIILAAGQGKRLGELTKEIPKCLLPVSEDETLLDLSLQALFDNGIIEIVLVVGFGAGVLKKHVEKKWGRKFNFNFINNDRFETTNNIYSAYLASDVWDDETILLNSDIIYDSKILKNLLQTIKITKGKISYLVIDDSKDLIEEDMKIIVNEDNEIKKINKALDIEMSFGEYIGISYLRGNERKSFLKALENNIKNNNLNLYYEDAIADILKTSIVLPYSTNNLKWTEVDTLTDLNHAKEILNKFLKVTA